ncbi:MAG TPA: hybrid sensor histidine kinase/response regulator [Desulfobulbus sp.]|nr:hybrid sensor histidine kinase/response regulator [Desulfobulbus sp.]
MTTDSSRQDREHHSGRRRRWLLYSLRSRLQVLTFVSVLVPMFLATWGAVHVLREHLVDDMQRQLHADVSAASLSYRNEVARVGAAIHAVSLDNTVKTTLRLGILGQLRNHIEQLTTQYQLDFLLVTDGLGELKVSPFPGKSLGGDFFDHPIVEEGMLSGLWSAGTMLEQDATLLHFLELRGKDITNAPVLAIEAASPIIIRDKVVGMVFGGTMVTDNHRLLDRLQEAANGDGVALVVGNRVAMTSILDKTGRRLRGVRFPVTLDYCRKAGVSKVGMLFMPGDDGQQVYDYMPLDTPEDEPVAAILCFRPLSSFHNLITSVRGLMLAIFGAAMVLALVLTWLVSRSIAGPLHRLAEVMGRMQQGEEVERLEVRRQDEIGDLVRGFNRMAATIGERIEDLNREIASREKAEQELSAESERLQVTLQSIADGVIAADIEGRVVLVNRVAEQLTGWSEEEARGRPVEEIFRVVSMSTGREILNPVARILAQERPELVRGDLVLRARNGEETLVTESCAPLTDNREQVIGAVLVFSDVSEQRKMEEELAKAKKLESVGVLAGGIAHDFNNLLTAILGNLSLARITSRQSDPHYRHIADAEQASLRARDLTKQLLTFSRGGAPVCQTVDLSSVIRESAGFVLRGSRIQATFEIASNLWLTRADVGQVGQVIDNLVINAMQAMPDGGEIRIGAVNYEISDDSSLPLTPGNYIQVSVEDHGVGILPEHRDKIFDPYFTTKEAGNGLGLAICYAIISKHGGHITVDSVVGSGSIFYVYLPAVAEGEECDRQVAPPPVTPGTGAGHILVMDDEEMVRAVACAMLDTMGYEVESVADGRQAVQVYREAMEQGRGFDVVIMDLTIPGGMGGKETLEELRRLDPEVRAVVSSGYSSHRIMSDYKVYGFHGVVVKPYRMGELSRVIKEVLED